MVENEDSSLEKMMILGRPGHASASGRAMQKIVQTAEHKKIKLMYVFTRQDLGKIVYTCRRLIDLSLIVSPLWLAETGELTEAQFKTALQQLGGHLYYN